MRAALLIVLLSATAHAGSEHHHLGVFVGGGYLKSTEGHGAALDAGIRLDLARNFSAGFDLGYGVFGTKRDTQDRWWLMPNIALVVPSGFATLDVGFGVGLAAASGYDDVNDFLLAPFDPSWALQLIPAGRVHVRLGVPVTPGFEIFTRLDAGGLLVEGNDLGFRSRNPTPTFEQRVWVNLWLGVQLNYL